MLDGLHINRVQGSVESTHVDLRMIVIGVFIHVDNDYDNGDVNESQTSSRP